MGRVSTTLKFSRKQQEYVDQLEGYINTLEEIMAGAYVKFSRFKHDAEFVDTIQTLQIFASRKALRLIIDRENNVDKMPLID